MSVSEAKEQEIGQLFQELRREADHKRITGELTSLFSKNEEYF